MSQNDTMQIRHLETYVAPPSRAEAAVKRAAECGLAEVRVRVQEGQGVRTTNKGDRT